jgi:polynucleotide 5'-hydroxyl-kinase GRC3/NOL9
MDRTIKEIYDRSEKRLIDRARRSNFIVFVLGDIDSGKTYFATHLIENLIKEGVSVGFVDSDIGQSKIGPPTTVGLSLPKKSSEIFLAMKLYFVGSTSPHGHMLPLVAGTKKMVEFSKAKNQVTVIDTTGTVQGNFGLSLKLNKIQLVQPEIVFALRKNSELDHIIAIIKKLTFIELVTVSAHDLVKPKTMNERYENRRMAFFHYFRNATPQKIDVEMFNKLTVNKPDPSNNMINKIFCAWDAQGYTNSIGIIEEIGKDYICVFAPPIELRRTAYFEIGELKLNRSGNQL